MKSPRIGGTKTVHVEAVLDLKPDLVVANREENERSQVEQLEEALGDNSVCVTDIRTVRQALHAIKNVGARASTAFETPTRWLSTLKTHGESPWNLGARRATRYGPARG